MSYIVQGLSFNPQTVNSEVFGNLEQTFSKDLVSPELQPHKKIKLVSSFDHYSSHCPVPPKYEIPSAVAFTPNLLPPNEVRSAVEFQALSVNHYLPIDKPQSYASFPSSLFPITQSPTYFRANEVGFSSLFSLEYSFSDYKEFGSKYFHQLGSGEHIDTRQNDMNLPHQLYLKPSTAREQMNPYFVPNSILQQQNLPVHEQPHILSHDQLQPVFVNAKEMENFAYSYPTLIEPTSITSDCKSNNSLLHPFRLAPAESAVMKSNSSNKSKSYFDPLKANSKINDIVTEKTFPKDMLIVSNLTTVKPVFQKSLKNSSAVSKLLSKGLSSDVSKNEIVDKPVNLPFSNNDLKANKDISKENLNFEAMKERQRLHQVNDCGSNPICDTKNAVKENNESKINLKPATSKDFVIADLSLSELKLNENFEAMKEEQRLPHFNNCGSESMCDTKNTVTVNSESKSSLKPATLKNHVTSDQSFNALKPHQGENLNILAKEKQETMSKSSILTSQSTILVEGHKHLPEKGLELVTCSDTSAIECDSTTESSIQPTHLSSLTNSLLPNLNETNFQNHSCEKFEPSLRDKSFPKALEETSFFQPNQPSKCRICKDSTSESSLQPTNLNDHTNPLLPNLNETNANFQNPSSEKFEVNLRDQSFPKVLEENSSQPSKCRICKDSTSESSLQPTNLNDHTNPLLPNLNETNANFQNPSSEKCEPNLRDQSYSEMLKETSSSQLTQPNKCRICKELLFTERPLLQQFTVPIDANFDVCNACNICFLQKSVLSTNSDDEENPHKCNYCGRRFKKECYLVLHVRSHTTEKPFKCKECNKAFANTAKLKLHSKTHSGDKPFACEECNRRFVQNSHLKMHFRIHLGNKPFKCKSCTKDFASKYRLSEHEKYHSPKLPFKCTTCEKSFVKKTYFESHMRIHCNAKPFECSICKTSFAQKSILRQHTKNCRFVIASKDVESVPNPDSRMPSIEG